MRKGKRYDGLNEETLLREGSPGGKRSQRISGNRGNLAVTPGRKGSRRKRSVERGGLPRHLREKTTPSKRKGFEQTREMGERGGEL